jgi:hypothetical protein
MMQVLLKDIVWHYEEETRKIRLIAVMDVKRNNDWK